MYWAIPLPLDAMRTMVENSLCFGLYSTTSEPSPLIGFARLITDTCTFAYLTDVYILPSFQSRGLGAWLISCVQTYLESLPHLRRSMLVTGREGPNVGFYERRMRMERLEGGDLVPMSWVGPGWGGGTAT
jgi:GNAT superfamily N-acetyltransferase